MTENNGKKKILIADDMPDFRTLLVIILQKLENIETLLAEDGEEAVEKMTKDNPDVALIDWQMPKMTGVEAVREAKRKGYKNRTILVTASALKDEIALVAKEFDDVLTKPFPGTILLAKVEYALSHPNGEHLKNEPT